MQFPKEQGAQASQQLMYSCDHPMIVRREDGGTYCTECGARVA